MVIVNNAKCTGCGICLRFYGGYCIDRTDEGIEIDRAVCNACQKCIAICPQMAFSVDGAPPVRIGEAVGIEPGDFMELLKRRRSIKHFKDKKVPREMLTSLIRAAQYAPTMNKDIEALVVDDEALIAKIDGEAIKRVRKMYNWLFKCKPVTRFVSLFSETLPIIKRKMERDLIERKKVVKDNTQALILLLGSTKVPVTESSAQYYMANAVLFAELVGLGSTLMDSLKIAVNQSRAARHMLGIPKGMKVLSVLAVGYPDEKIINIPQGYAIKMNWNKREI